MSHKSRLWFWVALLGNLWIGWATAGEPERPRSAPIRSGCEHDYAPFCIVRNGEADGFSVELLRASLQAMGRDVTFKTGAWAEIKQDLAEGRLQALPMVARTGDREETFDFTFPYYTMHGTIVVREDNTDIRGPADLRGKRVAVLQEDIAHEYLRKADLGAVIVPLPSFASALQELSKGKHDAVVIQKLLAFQIIKQSHLNNLRTVGPPLSGYRQVFCFAVRKGNEELLSLLNEGLSIVMADGTFRQLHAKWFAAFDAFARTKSRIVVGGDANYPPYEFLDANGQPAGYNVDLTRAIARQMGLSVDVRLADWAKIRAGLDEGEIDVVHGMFYSAERDKGFAFSAPHALIQHVVVVRKGSPPLADMQALVGKSILVMAADIMHDLAVQHGYRNNVVPVDTQEEALRRLAAGQQDCALVARVPALYWIEKNQWSNLVISGESLLSAEFCYAVPHEKELLLSEFAEGLAVVKKTGEFRTIQAKWLSPYEETRPGAGVILKYALLGAGPVLALLAGALLWTRSLKTQVRWRTQELENSKQQLWEAKVAAEAANAAKSQFLANMSHELRTPMNAILGMIDVALPKAVDPTIQDCLQTARGSADLLLTLLNDLLDSAKIESGKLELESAPFSLRRTLDQITRVLSVRASEKGFCFCCRMPQETPDAVLGDRMRLQQVLLNLAGNAIKFTEKGEVEINLRALSHDGEACLEFAVRDTGIGIPPSGLERLFQPFTQADASMARRFGGTGLGLSICKNLVEMMGGRIWAESELGKGSTFHFTVRLPLAKELPPDFETPAVLPAAACGQLQVLLVEDNPANQKLATYILQDRGHTVDIAGDGQEALSSTERNRYDVILMDVQMPGMDGLETTAAMRKRENGESRVPIIAMTAHAMKGDRERCLAAGMDGYVSKPVNAREMIGLVESLARGGMPMAEVAALAPDSADAAPQPAVPVFNPEEALTRCFNSADMVREMIQCFFDEADHLLPQMRAALGKGSLVEVGQLGHRMKGTVAYLGAQAAKEAALRVERFCKCEDGTPAEAEEAINALEHECIALKAALVKHPLAAHLAQND